MPNHQGGERELGAHRDFDDPHMEAGCTHKQQKQQEFGIEQFFQNNFSVLRYKGS